MCSVKKSILLRLVNRRDNPMKLRKIKQNVIKSSWVGSYSHPYFSLNTMLQVAHMPSDARRGVKTLVHDQWN